MNAWYGFGYKLFSRLSSGVSKAAVAAYDVAHWFYVKANKNG